MVILGKLVEVFLLGLVGGAVPGPILTAVFAEVLRSSFGKSLKVIFRALIAESAVALFILLFFYYLNLSQFYLSLISLGGAAVILWMAWQVWKIDQLKSDGREIFTFSNIIILTILNGGYWIFWITVCVPRAIELNQHLSGGQFIFLLIFEVGWLLATITETFIFSKFRPLLERKNLISTTFKIFALILVFFAVKSIVENLSQVLK